VSQLEAAACVESKAGQAKEGWNQLAQNGLSVSPRWPSKIANQRRDFWRQSTRQLVNQYDLICFENLTLGFMTANRQLARSAQDAALGEFRSLLAYKVEEAGQQVLPVPPQYTSQICSGRGTAGFENKRQGVAKIWPAPPDVNAD